MDSESTHKWHLDRRVPIALILGLAMQLAGGVWIASKFDSRLQRLEDDRALQHERDEKQDREVREANARMERQAADSVLQLRTQIERMDGKLDRLIESRGLK